MKNAETIKSTIKPILTKHGIKRAGLFGSLARGSEDANDVDLLVGIDQKMSLIEFIGLQQELEDILGCKVDLVEYSTIKPSLREEILKEEQPLL